jgi:hypothetical protein
MASADIIRLCAILQLGRRAYGLPIEHVHFPGPTGLAAVNFNLLLVRYRNVFSTDLLAIIFGTSVFHFLLAHSNMHRSHNSGFLVSPLCTSPSNVHCISARLYIRWSGFVEPEYTYTVGHHKTNVTLQYRFCLNWMFY